MNETSKIEHFYIKKQQQHEQQTPFINLHGTHIQNKYFIISFILDLFILTIGYNEIGFIYDLFTYSLLLEVLVISVDFSDSSLSAMPWFGVISHAMITCHFYV